MAGRDEGYYGPSDGDLGRGALGLLAVGVAGIALVIVLCAMAVADDAAAAPRCPCCCCGEGGGDEA